MKIGIVVYSNDSKTVKYNLKRALKPVENKGQMELILDHDDLETRKKRW